MERLVSRRLILPGFKIWWLCRSISSNCAGVLCLMKMRLTVRRIFWQEQPAGYITYCDGRDGLGKKRT